MQAVHAAVAQRLASYQQEFGIKEPQLAISAAQANEAPAQCLAPAAAGRLLDLLLTLPHGVMKYSHAVPGGWGWGWGWGKAGCRAVAVAARQGIWLGAFRRHDTQPSGMIHTLAVCAVNLMPLPQRR